MSKETNVRLNSSGIFLSLFFLVLFVLKMGVGNTAVQNWSWWWVTAPLWAGAIFTLVVILVMLLVIVVADLGKKD